MHILTIDPTKNLEEQFKKYEELTGISAVRLSMAYQQYKEETSVTSRFKDPEFLFEELQDVLKEETEYVEKKQSYQQRQRSLPKFLCK
jgi:hypothetical protein